MGASMNNLLNKIGLNNVNGYRYVKKLDGGKASVVCLYENEEGSKQVIKMLIAPRSEEELDSFKSEPQILAQLNRHDTINIPKLISGLVQVTEYPVYYYIMEYIDGVTLSSYIDNNPLPWDANKALKMIACITSALSKTSRHHIVHRDLHPGNIILKKTFNLDKQFAKINVDVDVIIMDYGCHKESFRNLAYYFTDTDYSSKSIQFNKRDYLRHFGAISTWSPEFLKDPHSVDVHHDIWALGVMLFRFITKKYPLWAKSFSDLYEKLVLKFDIDWKLIKESKVHWAIEEFLIKMLDPNPKCRPLHNDIIQIIIGLLSDDLYKQSDSFINEYLVRNGDYWTCPNCFKTVFPSGSRCTACGQMSDSFDWINPFL